MDKYWPYDLPEPQQKVSLLNEVPEYRDREGATVLHRWPKGRPIHAIIAETLANVELLLADAVEDLSSGMASMR